MDKTITTNQFSLINDTKAAIYKILGCDVTPLQNAKVHAALEILTEDSIKEWRHETGN